jgi:hypothetical protein
MPFRGIFVELKKKQEVEMTDGITERIVFQVSPDASNERWVVSRENADFRREFNKKEMPKVLQRGEPGKNNCHR